MNRVLGVTQFSYLAGASCFLNFSALYLSDSGFTDFQVGVLQAAAAALMLLSQPLLGRYLDRRAQFKRTTLAVLSCSMVLLAVTPFLRSNKAMSFLLVMLLYAILKQYNNVFDVWTYRLKTANPQITYGATRGIGSIGEGATAFVIGSLILAAGYSAVFLYSIFFLLIALAATRQNTNPPVAAEERPKAFSLRGRPTFTAYLLSVFFLNVLLKMISIFSSLIIKNLGGGSAFFGVTVLLCGIAELPVFIFAAKKCSHSNVKWWYFASICLGLLGSSLAATASGFAIFTVGRVINTVAYALYTTTNLEFVQHHVEEAHRAGALLLLVTVSSNGGHIVSSLLGGYLVESGNKPLFVIALGILFVLSITAYMAAFYKRRREQ